MLSKRRSLGQHFLSSTEVGEKLVDSAGIGKDDVVLEIGTGKGFVTNLIMKRTLREVYSFEIDPKLASLVKDRFGSHPKLKIIRGDFLEQTNEIPSFDVCIASLPYSRSLDFIQWLSLRSGNFRAASIIIQKEFVSKLISYPGSKFYRSVSVISQLSFDLERVVAVDRTAFSPPPKVLSEIVRIRPNARFVQPLFNKERIKALKIMFSFRGKLARTAVRHFSKLSRSEIPQETLNQRLENLTPQEFFELITMIEHERAK